MHRADAARWAHESNCAVSYDPATAKWREYGDDRGCYVQRRHCDCRYDGRISECNCIETAPFVWHVKLDRRSMQGVTYDSATAVEMVEEWVEAWKEIATTEDVSDEG